MSSDLKVKSAITDARVARWVVEKVTTDSAVEAQLRQATTALSNGGMISGADSGALLMILARSVRARKALEIGTFTGYTALKIASGLTDDGKLICCDINKEWTSIGRPFWREAGLDQRIDLRLAPALDTLKGLITNGERGTFDFAFIDADKGGYESYYEACLELIRPGGLIVLDNMLWDGAVADEKDLDKVTVTLRNLNLKISTDKRVSSCLLTVGDGMMLAIKN